VGRVRPIVDRAGASTADENDPPLRNHTIAARWNDRYPPN
jgi:hypothetical protein